MIITDYLPTDLFKGQTVFITGGGSGINLGIGRHFAALGANIGICGRTPEKLQAAAAELRALGAEVVAEPADVRNPDALGAAMDTVRERLGAIGVLVAGAAGNFPCAAEGLSPNGFKSVMDIDVLGAFNAARLAFEQLKETRGSILFISAGQAYYPYAYQCHVGAAKAAIDNLMRNLALEWGPHGIRSNSIAPGPIKDTEGMRRLAPGNVEQKMIAHIPIGRFGTIDDVAQAAVFLASPLASYITGAILFCDGGQNLPGSGIFTQAMLEAFGA